MATLEYTVTGQRITTTQTAELVKHTIGYYTVRFTFDGTWDAYSEKWAVFDPDFGESRKQPLDANGQCDFPGEVMNANRLNIGVYGVADGVQYPTIWTGGQWLKDGAYSDCPISTYPEPEPILEGMVSATKVQSFTDAQKEQARENIGANEIPGGTPGNLTIIDNNENIADSGLSKNDILLSPQLSSHIYAEDQTPYLYRQTGGGVEAGTREYDSIVGGSVVYNQLVVYGNFETATGWAFSSGGTFSVSNNIGIITCTSAVVSTSSFYTLTARRIANHRYYYHAEVKEPVQNSTQLQVHGGCTSMLAAAEPWLYYDGLVKTTSDGSGEVRLYFNRSNVLTSGDVVNIKNVMLIDVTAMFGATVADALTVDMMRAMFGSGYLSYSAPSLQSAKPTAHKTVGFNLWDEEWESGTINSSGQNAASTAMWRTKNYIPVFPGQTYYICQERLNNTYNFRGRFYDSNKNFLTDTPANEASLYNKRECVVPSGTYYLRFSSNAAAGESEYGHDVCVNISDPLRNGEYEPYQEHTYPLAGIELRGVPAVDSDGNIYFDGDTYAPDGAVTRRYGIITLNGSETSWNKSSSYQGSFYFNMRQAGFNYKGFGKVITPDLVAVSSISNYAVGNVYPESDSINFWFPNMESKTLAQFKEYISEHPITVVYELKTPTTETAEPYESLQICDPLGTEEYVDERAVAVPVGHVTRYPVDQVAKLDGLPSDFSTLIAPTEKTYTATQAYAVKDLVIVDNQLYRVTSAISSGNTITPGTNCTAVTVASLIKSLI